VERGMLTGGTELTGERNVYWRKKTAFRRECCLKEERGLERVMLTGRSKRA